MSNRMGIGKTEQFCFVCRGPGQLPSDDDASFCMTAEPAEGSVYAPPDLPAEYVTDSFLEIFDSSNQLYRISYAGMPVTTHTIAVMCGGQAPFLWRTKQLQATTLLPLSPLEGPWHGAIFSTRDGALYSWTHTSKWGGEFSYMAERTTQSVENVAHANLMRALIIAMKIWMRSNEDSCTDASQNPLQCGPNLAMPETPFPSSCPGGGALSSAESRLIASLTPGLNDTYFPRGEARVPVVYCPVPNAIGDERSAHYNTENRAITLFPKLFEWAERAESTADAARFILAHEFGHARHDLASGTLQSAHFFLGATMGLPARLAVDIQAISEGFGLHAGCAMAFAESLRERAGLPVTDGDSGHSQLFSGELIATLYAIDLVVADQPATITPNDRALMLENVHSYTEQIGTSLTKIYTLFPDSVAELRNLYWTVAFDPLLQERTKEIGLDILLDVARALPPRAHYYLTSGDPPLRCGTPSILAAFPQAATPFLEEDDWCHTFDDGLHEPRGTPARIPIPTEILQW